MIYFSELIKLNCLSAVFKSVFFILIFVMSKTTGNESNKIDSYRDLLFQSVNSTSLEHFNAKYTAPKLVCFYVFTTDFKPEIMDGLCTHINIGFLGIDEKNYSLPVTPDKEKILLEICKLKNTNHDLKILISIGGAEENNFSSMVVNHRRRKQFIKNCIEFIKKFKIDGIDLDWEWPVITEGNQKEKIKFIQLLREIREEFDRHKKKYILSVDVASIQSVIELAYYVQYIPTYVDHINVLCYDYHFFTKIYPFTGHNSPLYSVENFPFRTNNVNHSISFWLKNSVPKEKIVMGLPTYGHTFKLIFSKHHSLDAPAKGFGSVGQNGFADYRQICEFLRQENTTIIYDDVSKVPYAFMFPEWVSYDDERSLAIKVSYILERQLGGAMVFSVNSDDFDGTCSDSEMKLPLLKKIRSILFNEV